MLYLQDMRITIFQGLRVRVFGFQGFRVQGSRLSCVGAWHFKAHVIRISAGL